MSQTPDRHPRARALFELLREQPRAAQTAALSAACAGDAILEAEVTRLLAAAEKVASFLEHGAAAALAAERNLVGRTIGPYEVRGILGIGGMGEVYRARDTTLRRDVALKVLPEFFTADPDRVARFRREAQVLASLNHPNIAAIYGLDESHGMPVLVLELVEGPTLADRLERGPMRLDEVLSVARQVADALVAAHAIGVVHRDLKPDNLKVRADGTVKVLDFGLAKTVELSAADSDSAQSPVVTGPDLTRAGVILGTARCMSPEQTKGRPIDKRSDIWAFGCMLFEMLTARPAFGGEDVADTLAAILTKEPDWSLLPAATPSAIRRVLRRCLEKDRSRRLADMADARLELDEPGADATSADGSSLLRSGAIRRWAPWSIAAASLAAALWLVGSSALVRPTPDANVYRTSILLPERLGAPRSVVGTTLALSPDGRQLAFVASDASGRSRLWTRALDGLDARPLPDTVGAQSPFWSPDGRWLAFVQDRHLKKIAVAGGAVVTLCDSAMIGGAWNNDGVILFTQPSGILAEVPAAGGTPAPLTTIDANRGEVFNVQPFFLPDGWTFGYVSLGLGSVHAELYVASLDAKVPRKRLPIDASVVQYAAGYLWFMRGSTLMAQAFDADSGVISDQAVPVAEQVRIDNGAFRGGVFSVSPAGTLVFQGDPAPGYELVWYNRAGKVLGTLGTPAEYADVQLSPDGQRVLVSVAPTSTGIRDLWIFDVARGLRTRFTFDDTRSIRNAIWSPDGSRIVFATERDGHVVLMQKPASGAGDPQILLDDPFDKEPISWSPDGRYILYSRRAEIATPETWVLPLGSDAKPFELAYPRGRFATFSPDGRWIAFTSSESGRGEVYVAPFPEPGSSWQVSTAGGLNPRWRADGKEILYLSLADNKLMSATVTLGRDRVDVGAVKPLFELPWIGPRYTHDISPDAERILALAQPSGGASAPLTLIVNWPALLKN